MTAATHGGLCRSPRRGRLAAALLAALALPGAALADDAREAALEARIAQLERLVQELVAERETVRAAPAAAPAPGPTIQSTPIMPAANPGTRFSYGGFIKLDAMLTDTSDGELPGASAGRTLYVPGAIPVGGPGEGVDVDMHAQFSRFWFAADSELDSGDKLRGYLEFDLFGGALGNEAATSTYGVTVRHAFATWNNWLAGQTWSNFQDVAALPDAVDFIGPTDGTVFVRQAQVRYTSGPWSFAVENPESVVGTPGRVLTDDNSLPDFTLRYTHRHADGHFSAAGLLRQIGIENPATGIDDSTTGYGVSLSGRQVINSDNDFRYMLIAGRGISRYIGLATANDAHLDSEGDLDETGVVAGYAAWRHAFNPGLRGNLYYSAAHYDHDVAISGPGATKRVHSLAGNLIWTVLPKLDVGVELRFANRELESGADGDLRRLQMHAKYSF